MIVLALAASLAALGSPPAAQAQTRRVTVQMDWVIGGAHAEFFIAKDKGFYAAKGLDVTISRGFGSAAGTRSFHSTCQSEAAYERINSTAVGCGERRPRRVLIVTGKNVR